MGIPRPESIMATNNEPLETNDKSQKDQTAAESDTPRGAGGLMSWAVSKTAGPWV